MNLTQKIESYLFYTGEAIAIKKIARIFEVSEGEVQESLKELEQLLQGRGVVIMKNGNEVMLATRPEMGEFFQEIKKGELSDPLSKAALETLTIILYKDGATKSEIDFIRGVNSGFMLRNLLIRGLIEKIPNPDDARVSKYRTTFDTLRFLGVTQVEELPHFESFKQELEKREEISSSSQENVFNE